MEQLNIFSYTLPQYKITKPIRLIELFAGIGSQAKALENLNANFKNYQVIEFDKYAIASYNAIHGTNFATQDITQIGGSDLGIVDTDKYEYILTYSFPCQDLSLAGKQKGMTKGDNTRSSLLWEVERLLDECKELPQILLMENVPQILSQRNIADFQGWQYKLEQLGYSNYVSLLNAKDYGIPQNRNRCFMVSILGKYYYKFPHKQELKLRLKDMLEDEVDEKYYLSETAIQYMFNTNYQQNKFKTRVQGEIASTPCARDYKDPKCILVGNLSGGKWDKINECCRRVYNVEKIRPTVHTMGGGNAEPKVLVPYGSYYTWKNKQGNYNTQCNRAANPNNYALTVACGEVGKVLEDDLKIRKLTPKECWRLMGFADEDFEKASKVNSNAQLYKQAGNSIVVNVLEAIFKELL